MGRRPYPHRNGKHWRCTINGQKYGLGTNENLAFSKFYTLLEEHGRADESAPLTIEGVVEKWRRVYPSDYNRHFSARLIAWANNQGLHVFDVHKNTLRDYLAWLKRQRPLRPSGKAKVRDKKRLLAPKTIRHHYHVARQVFAWAHDEKGWITTAPLPAPSRGPAKDRLPKPVRVPRDVPIRQLEKALQSFGERGRHAERVARFMLYTGARTSEAVSLQWDQIDLDARVCTLTENKTAWSTGDVREVYLTDDAVELIEAVPTTEGYVFLSRLGRPYTVGGLRSVFKRHGLPGTYCLRHTFAQNASYQIPEEELGELMGHRDPKTTRRYYEVRSDRLRKAAKGLRSAVQPPALPLPSDVTQPTDDEQAKPHRNRSAGKKPRAKRRVS